MYYDHINYILTCSADCSQNKINRQRNNNNNNNREKI